MQASPETISSALDKVKDQASFVQELLLEALEWDIPEEAESVSELGYEWYLDEDFDFSEDQQKHLSRSEILQIPIVRNKNLFGDDTTAKWGVFVVRFKDKECLQQGRGLTSPLRKILRKIIRNRNTLAGSSDRPLFERENILFICADETFRNVTFARFKSSRNKRVPPLTAFGWRADEKNAVRTLCQHNLPHLHWDGDWAKAFDIERVTKAFYKEIFNWFEAACPQISLPLRDAVRVLDRKLEDLKSEAVIRLVIRLIFIWFMKEKRGLVPERLFDQKTIQNYLRQPIGDKGFHYYNAVLQNLFFATLNCPQETRRFRRDHEINDTKRANNDRGISILYRFKDDLDDPEGLQTLLSSVPFLNGGLFTCHDDIQKFVFGRKRESYHLDGYSENPDDRAIVPDCLFFAPDGRSGLIDILKHYHFTIEEHTPLEQEVALDPELLGHVFENLLAAYNPETKETARKKTGSYYTPRNIVDYMVGESLKNYLGGRMGWRDNPAKQADLDTLLDYEQEGNPFDEEESSNLRTALYGIRIFDPACGSGAFPMGALQRLNHVLERLNEEKSSYRRKLDLISKNIYGADIQPIATEITTQRFFISLLIDQKVDASAPNSGVEPLPNLEVKFMTANTLQSLDWHVETDLTKGTQDDLFYSAVSEQVEAIKTVFVEYLKATTAKEKDDIRAYFENAKETLLQEFASVNIPEEDRARFKAWEPFGFSKSAGFFDPQLMFGLPRPDAFDIVIGNPPYVRQESIKNQKPALKKEFGNFFKGTADLYTYFYKKGIQLLKPGGILTYITPNKFMTTAYGDKTRKLLTEEAFPMVLIDFNETPVFEATTYPLIAIVQKGEAEERAEFASLPEKDLNTDDWTDPATAIAKYGFKQTVSSLLGANWVLERPEILSLLKKLTANSTSLGEYVNGEIMYGIKTGLNAAFVIDQETKDRLIVESPNSADVIKPWLRGRDIQKWRADYKNLYVIFTRRGTDIDQYPAIKKYLSKFREDLEPKNKKGQKKGRKAGSYKWFEIQDNIAYFEKFDGAKIMYPNMANEARFNLDNSGAFSNDKSFIMPSNDYFLLGVLNSNVATFWCWHSLPKLMGASMEFRKVFMKNLTIPNATKDQKSRIAALAEEIISLKAADPNADIADLEQQINQIVYGLFNLTEAEIALVEGREVAVQEEEPFVLPDLATLPDNDWATPKGLNVDELNYIALVNAMRLAGNRADPSRIRTLVIVALKPAIALAFMDDARKAGWLRLIGAEAQPLPANVISLSQFQENVVDRRWGNVIKRAKTTEALIEDRDGSWSMGENFLPKSVQPWMQGRMAIVQDLLSDIDQAEAEQKIVTFIRSVEDGATERVAVS